MSEDRKACEENMKDSSPEFYLSKKEPHNTDKEAKEEEIDVEAYSSEL